MNDNEDNVVPFNAAFHGDLDASIILEAAAEHEYEMMMVIGFKEDGEFYMATSTGYLGDHLLLLQRGIKEVMDIQQGIEEGA